MTTSKQGRTESNHVRWLWRPTAHPGARPYCTQDCVWVGAILLSQEHVPDNQSAQRESNPRVHPGKVAGYRYITDATQPRKSTQPRVTGLEPAPPSPQDGAETNQQVC